MLKKIISATIAVCVLFSFTGVFSQQIPTIHLDTSEIRIPDKGDRFTLPIKALNHLDIFTYELSVSFDADYIKAVDIIGSDYGFEGIKEIDNEEGEIKFQYCINGQTLTGDVLAKITFEVTEIGIPKVSVNPHSIFLSKPTEGAEEEDAVIGVEINSLAHQYPGSAELRVGTLQSPRFVSERRFFASELDISFAKRSDGADIYYTMVPGGTPNKKYVPGELLRIYNTTTITAHAEKNGVKSKTEQMEFVKNASASQGNTYTPTTPAQPALPNTADMTNQPEEEKYSDIEGHWSEDYFKKLIEKNIISGYEDNTVRPDRQITRAEAAKIIALAANLSPAEDESLNFADSKDIADWARGYIMAVYEKGIITGYEDNTFLPNQNITRAELVVVVSRAFSLDKSSADEISFEDGDTIPNWAMEGVASAVNKGLISGYDDNTFRPQSYITRAEASKIIYNCIEL